MKKRTDGVPRGMFNIVILGFVSFFTDIGTEMVYPILPLFLTATLGASPAIIGIIEGIAESLAAVIKLLSGLIADKYNNKKQLAFWGYFASFFNKAIILLSTTWGGVLFARVVDRFGKGVRTAPRDALIAESTAPGAYGKSYGIHKTFDMLGSSIGILLAFMLMAGQNFRQIIFWSMIPALIGPLCVLFVKGGKVNETPKKLNFKWGALNKKLKLFLIATFIFTLGNSSNAFILLRAAGAGFTARDAIFLYFIFNATASLLAYPLGKLSDKIGRKVTLPLGLFIYGVVYYGIGLFSSRPYFYVLFIAYGVYNALVAGGERALVAELAPAHLKSSALGLHSAVVGVGLLPASIFAGLLWYSFGQTAPFVVGGTLAFAAGIALLFILRLKDDVPQNGDEVAYV